MGKYIKLQTINFFASTVFFVFSNLSACAKKIIPQIKINIAPVIDKCKSIEG